VAKAFWRQLLRAASAIILKMKKFTGTVLRKSDKCDELLTSAKQTQYRSGMGNWLLIQ
jgi:hypothetical protein